MAMAWEPRDNRGAITLVMGALLAVGLVFGHAAMASPAGFTVTEVADLDQPWAMAFLPDGSLLITEKSGQLLLRQADGNTLTVKGVPEVAYGGQGGLGDVVLHPEFASNGLVYLSYAEAGDGGARPGARRRFEPPEPPHDRPRGRRGFWRGLAVFLAALWWLQTLVEGRDVTRSYHSWKVRLFGIVMALCVLAIHPFVPSIIGNLLWGIGLFAQIAVPLYRSTKDMRREPAA